MKLFVVPHTHWDREWYMTFRETRAKLVNMIDILLKLMEGDPHFRFMLDGQTVVLEDYLEVKPENGVRLRKMIEDGRLAIGPWYVQPDEFLVSGESLIRNILIGDKITKQFGKKMNAGYLPDTFGHICEMPMILRGFDIDSFIFMRGAGNDIKKNIFTWKYRDGSSVIAVHLLPGYGNGAQLSCIPFKEAKERVETLLKLHNLRGSGEPLLLMNGSDHLFPEPEIGGLLSAFSPSIDFEMGDIGEYISRIKENIKESIEYEGELRESNYVPILPGVLSTRVYLKQKNREIEDLILFYLEPLLAYDHIAGIRTEDIERLWKDLLKNHAHDSIYGCGIDEVHAEVIERFEKVELEVKALLQKYDTESSFFSVYNPLNWRRKEVVEVESCGGKLIDSKGRAVPYALIGDRAVFIAEIDGLSFGYYSFCDGINEVEGTVKVNSRSIENEFLKIEINENGYIDLYDRMHDRWFRNLNEPCDIEDRGDEYNFCAASEAKKRESFAFDVVESTPIRGAIRIQYLMNPPVSCTVSVSSGIPRANITVEVENSTLNHRLSILFPCRGRVIAGSKFCSLERKHGEVYERDPAEAELLEKIAGTRRPEGKEEGWVEDPPDSYPFDRFVYTNGLAIAAKGLFEYSFVEGKLSITLLRCIGKLSKDNLSCRRGHAGPGFDTPGAQCIGKYRFEYSLIPCEEKAAIQHSMSHNLPFMVFKGKHDSLMKITPSGLILSCIKVAEDKKGIVVRLFNPEGKRIRGSIELNCGVQKASEVDLKEEEKKALAIDGKKVLLDIEPFSLLSVKVLT